MAKTETSIFSSENDYTPSTMSTDYYITIRLVLQTKPELCYNIHIQWFK